MFPSSSERHANGLIPFCFSYLIRRAYIRTYTYIYPRNKWQWTCNITLWQDKTYVFCAKADLPVKTYRRMYLSTVHIYTYIYASLLKFVFFYFFFLLLLPKKTSFPIKFRKLSQAGSAYYLIVPLKAHENLRPENIRLKFYRLIKKD